MVTSKWEASEVLKTSEVFLKESYLMNQVRPSSHQLLR